VETLIDMVWTRGCGSQPEGRTRPTTLVRRRDRSTSSSALVGGADVVGGGADVGEAVGFPRNYPMSLYW